MQCSLWHETRRANERLVRASQVSTGLDEEIRLLEQVRTSMAQQLYRTEWVIGSVSSIDQCAHKARGLETLMHSQDPKTRNVLALARHLSVPCQEIFARVGVLGLAELHARLCR